LTKAAPTKMCNALIPSSFPHPNRAQIGVDPQ
jgi:hypothetical protein